MPRQARLDSPGTLHHVIVRGIEKRDIVKDKHDRKNVVSRLYPCVRAGIGSFATTGSWDRMNWWSACRLRRDALNFFS